MTSLKLQTTIDIPASRFPIDHGSKIFVMGSCFAENMGDKLQYYQFQNLINPFGILFHPTAIERILDHVKGSYEFRAIPAGSQENNLVFDKGRWHCLDVHSRFSDADNGKVLNKFNQAIDESWQFIEGATHVIITLGTAWGYRYLESGNIVANCHKIPQKHFKKELASVEQLENDLRNSIELLLFINSDLKIILTISPVRHLKDGFVENQQSKAHLIAGLHKTIKNFDNVEYFPAYELMMDELRDYRFYDRDLLHPNALAIDYIWERFADCFFSAKAKILLDQVAEARRGLNHRPFNPASPDHLKFKSNLEEKIKILRTEIPHLSF